MNSRNEFSRKLRNHSAATALNCLAYNFIKIHRTLRPSPAMQQWSRISRPGCPLESYDRNAERAARPSDPGTTKDPRLLKAAFVTRQIRNRRNRRYLLIAGLLILGVGIGEVAVLQANWLAFAK